MNPAVKLPLTCRLLVIVAAGALSPLLAQQPHSDAEPKAPATLTELRQRLTEIVEAPRFHSAVFGVKVVSLDSGETLFEHDADKLLSPASNSKLYTVALALHELGPDYRIRTSVYAERRPDAQGVLEGDLIVYGRGDPCIKARLNGGDVLQGLAPLAQSLTNAGLRRVTGSLVGDSSYFHGPPFGSGWVCDDPQYYYGAEISALTINDNIVQAHLRPGAELGVPCTITLEPETEYLIISNRTVTAEKETPSRISTYRPLGGNVVYVSGRLPLDDSGTEEELTVHEPAGLFIDLFRKSLAQHGVEIVGKSRTVSWLDAQLGAGSQEGWVELASVESPPMNRLAREVHKPSQNLYTDLLLAHVGEKTRAPASNPTTTSEDLGIAALRRFLSEVGIPRGSIFFEEGSGLSRNNLTTPSATVALLRYMDGQPYGPAYLESLPVAGVDGTLRNRMKNTPAAGNVRAKTGTLRWAHALSGHVTTAVGERLVFSLMLNRYWSPGRVSARAELDSIAVLLAGFTGRSR